MVNEDISDSQKKESAEMCGLSLKQARYSRFLAVMTALFAINNVIYFTPGFFGVLYYGMISVFIILSFSGGGRLQLNVEMWLLYAVGWLSILANDIPAVFRSEFRCTVFMIVTILLSPAVTSGFLASFRLNLLRYLLKGCVIVSVLSFIGRFIGFSVYVSNTGLWCGITAHSMLLGPIAGVAAISLLNELLEKRKTAKILYYWRVFALISSVFCVLGAASRTSIIAVFAGFVYLVVKKGSFQKTGGLILVGFIVLAVSFSFVSSMWKNVSEKNKNETSLNLDSRSNLWSRRLEEFKGNPFLGIGFASIEESADGGTPGMSNGKIEPGSSWLIIISMMGVIGAGAFLLLLNNTLVRLARCGPEDLRNLLYALCIFWALEMCAEGFIFASGSFLFFMIWTLAGAIEGTAHLRENSGRELV